MIFKQEEIDIKCEDFRHSLALDDPVTLPLGIAGISQPQVNMAQSTQPVNYKSEIVNEEPDDDENPSEADIKNATPISNTNSAALLQSGKPVLLMVQLPDVLPGMGSDTDNESSPNESTTGDAADSKLNARFQLRDIPEGLTGRLVVRRSGRITFVLGDMEFDVTSGTTPAFRQEVVSVVANDKDRTADITVLGSPQHKLIITPNWDKLLASPDK